MDEELWQKGFNDRLETRQGSRWSKLMVLKSDVLKLWSFGDSAMRTGVAGRPTPIHLVLEEHERRLAQGGFEQSVRAEAAHLANWLASTHSGLPRLSPGTIENRIRSRHRKATTK